MTVQEFEAEAEAHWKWLESTLHKVYVDAMVHGFKHGFQEAERRRQERHDKFAKTLP